MFDQLVLENDFLQQLSVEDSSMIEMNVKRHSVTFEGIEHYSEAPPLLAC